MPTIQDMNAQTISPDSLGLAATTQQNINQMINLNSKVQDKVSLLSSKRDRLLGLNDADTPVLENAGTLRETPTTGARYDAVELQHGDNAYDMYGTDKKAEGEYGKSTRAMAAQRAEVARILGKPEDSLTAQDMIDVGNQQQIQKLADLVRSPNEPRWEAPLIRGVEQTNLTGNYKDENGNDVYIPLDVEVGVQQTGAKDLSGSRNLGSLVNAQTGENVTNTAALDARQNAFAGNQSVSSSPMYSSEEFEKRWNEAEGAGEGRLGESIDLAQSEATRYWGDMAAAARSASRALADKIGVSKENIDKYLPKNPELLGTDLSVNEARKDTEKRDLSVGYGTRKEWNQEQEKFKDYVGNGEYADAAWNVVTNLDRYLATSAPEMGALMVPGAGIPAVVATRLNNQMEEFEANNGRKMTTAEAFETAASIVPALVAEKLIVKSGITGALGKGKTLKDRANGVGMSTVGEAAQEGAESTQEQWATGKAEDRYDLDKLGEYATSNETIGGVIAGGTMGGSLRGIGEVVGSLGDAKQAAKEVLDDKLSNLDYGTSGESVTKAGLRNKWESALDVEVEPENRAAYTRDLARYAAEEFVRSGDLEGDYKKNPSKIFEDATERIAKVNGISSDEGKDLIGRQLAKQVYDRTQDVDTKGNRAFSVEKGREILSNFVNVMKGNKGVEDTLEREFEKELEAKFEEVRTRLAKEGVDTDDLSNRGMLTKDELDNLVKTLDSMKTLGSEKLKSRADDIQSQLVARQERLGSEASSDEEVKAKKDFKAVRDEIETLGFLTKGKKSLQQHQRDLDAFVVDTTADNIDRQKTLNTLEAFVASRNAKINVAERKAGQATRFRSIGELKNFAKETYADNEKILNVITGTADRLVEGKDKDRLVSMANSLKEVQGRLGEVIHEGGTVDQDKELLKKVGSWSKFTSEAEVDAFKDYVDNYKKVDVKDEEDLPSAEEVASKIMRGEELTVEDLQAQRNDVEYGENKIESILKEEASKETTKAEELTNKLDSAVVAISDYKKELTNLLSRKESLLAKKAVIRNLIEEQNKELDKLELQAKKLSTTIKGMESKTVDDKLEIIVSNLVRKILQGVRLLKGKLNKLLDRIATKKEYKKANEEVEKNIDAEINEVIESINKLENALEPKEEIETEVETEEVVDVSEFRNSIEEVLGDSITKNKSGKNSLTARLFSGVDVMSMMPRIIRDSETGKAKVDKALEVLEGFERDRNRPLILQNTGADTAVLEQLGLDKLFSDKSIEDKVKKAMNISSVVALSDIIDARRIKGEQLDQFIDGAFGNLWSVYDEIKKEKKQISNLISSGKIVPIATFTRNAGRRLLEELEIKLDTKTMQEYDDAVNALGAIVVNNILWKDSKLAQVAKGSLTINKGKVVVKSGFNKDVDLGDGNAINVLDLSRLTGETIKDIGDAGMVFEYAKEQTDGMISLEPVTHRSGKAGRNTDVKIGKDAEEYLNAQGNKPWKFDSSFINLWEAIGKDVNVLKDMILGTKEELLANTPAMEVESAMAKFVADELDVERMMMAYELVGDKEFYLGWDYTVSNRNMINNKMINPQNSKISRFIVGMEGMRHKLEVSDGERIMIEHSILQAFDGDPDKKSDDNVRKSLKDKGVEINIVRGKYEVTLNEKIEKLISKGTVISLQGIKKELGIHGAHLMHAYQALTLLKELKASGGKDVQTNLAIEADGITNGMATTTLQMGLQIGTADYFIKSGLYMDKLDTVSGKKISSHGEFKEAEGKDFYETPVEEVKIHLDDKADVIERIIGGSGKWRSYLKPLVMVYAYGASMSNIVTNGSRDLILKVLNNKKLSIKEVYAQLEEIGISEVISSNTVYKARYGMDSSGALRVHRDPRGETAYVDDEMLEKMVVLVEETVGDALARGFDSAFRPVTEYRRALKVVNQLSYLVFRNELDKELKELGVSKIGDLSKEQMAKLTDKMVKDGTWYGSNTSLGTTQDYFKTQQALGAKGEVITVSLPTKWGEYSNGTGYPAIMNKIIKEAASNVGAVGVIDVHSIDGATMIKGHVTDVLNIFDALVMSTNFKLNKEQMEAINQAYIDINMNHSVLGKAVEKLLKNADKFREITSLKGQLSLDILADIKRIFAIGKKDNFVEKLTNGIQDVIDTLDTVDAGRRKLVNKAIDVKQYYISDELGGGKWEGKEPTGRYAVFSNDEKAEEERAMVAGMITKLKNVALGLEERRKQKNAKINKKQKVNYSMAVTATNRRLESKYHESMNELVKEIVGPKVTESEFLGLSKATLDNIAIVGGQYTKGKVTVSKTPNMDKMRAQLEGVFDDWYINNSEYSKYQEVDETSLREALDSDKAYSEVKDLMVEDMLKEAVVKFASINGAHTLAHEMVHAGSVEFMKNNPNHEYTRRVEELYKLAIDNKDSILHHMGVGANEYWATSKEEFIAEGLSNPDLVYALTNVKVKGKPKMFNVFREMLETLCKMIGVAKGDSAYEYLLDGYLAMLRSQVPQTVEGAKRLDKLHQHMQDVYSKNNINSLKEKLSC